MGASQHLRKKRNEAGEQASVFEWATLSESKYPGLDLMYHIPNGGKRGRIEAARLKAQGVKAGIPDICLPVSRRGYHSLYIEMKAEGGKVRPKQSEKLLRLRDEGNLALVVVGFEDAVKLIEWYMNGEKTIVSP